MQKERIQAAFQHWGLSSELQYTRTLTSSVTTAWGVNWSEVYIARDLMQNFFDANRDCLATVQVKVERNDVAITAPTPFNLERLFYLGSEKGEDDVGQYGEGFKVAATCLLRDHNVTPIIASGHDVVCLRVADRAVADTDLYPVEYDFYRSDLPLVGTALILPGCSGKLIRALSQGLSHFLYDGNPLLGAKRWSNYRDEFSIYDSQDGHGHIFYRKLKRGEMEGIPIVLVINKQYQQIEKKISKDRDRNAFGGEVMELFYNHFARYGVDHDAARQRILVEAARSYWQKGHPLIREVSKVAPYGGWPAAITRELFGNRYCARSSRHHDLAQQLEIEGMERRWREEGKLMLPEYFQRFGVPSAGNELKRLHEQALEEEKRQAQRAPTAAEEQGIRLLSKVLQELAPEVFAFFSKGSTTYAVARTETLLGALRSGRGYGSRIVFLAESVFVADFSAGLATFLHEHAHIFGHDGSRGFTDALTNLLEKVVRYRSSFDEWEAEWNGICDTVRRERNEPKKRDDGEELEAMLDTLGEAELRQLMKRMLMTLLEKTRRSRT